MPSTMTRTKRAMTPTERQQLQKFLGRIKEPRSAPKPKKPTLAGHWKGLLGGVVVSLVMFVVWREVVWQAGLGFSFVGLVLGALLGGAAGDPLVTERPSPMARMVELALVSGEVEELAMDVSGAIVLREEGEDVWFLQVEPNQLLCLWEPREVRQRLTLVWAHEGDVSHVLHEGWSGEKVMPLRPRRAFRVGEFRPKFGATLLQGTLDQLDSLLQRLAPTQADPTRPLPPLVKEVEALGFYKFVEADLVERVKAEYAVGPDEWLMAAGRAFEADAELLSEGGVASLLEVMQSALAREGVVLGALSETVREGAGVLLTTATESHQLWTAGEPEAKLVERLQSLLDRRLEQAGSKERVFVRGDRLVLLTAELNAKL